jgi:hypothetical protein
MEAIYRNETKDFLLEHRFRKHNGEPALAIKRSRYSSMKTEKKFHSMVSTNMTYKIKNVYRWTWKTRFLSRTGRTQSKKTLIWKKMNKGYNPLLILVMIYRNHYAKFNFSHRK